LSLYFKCSTSQAIVLNFLGQTYTYTGDAMYDVFMVTLNFQFSAIAKCCSVMAVLVIRCPTLLEDI